MCSNYSCQDIDPNGYKELRIFHVAQKYIAYISLDKVRRSNWNDSWEKMLKLSICDTTSFVEYTVVRFRDTQRMLCLYITKWFWMNKWSEMLKSGKDGDNLMTK